MRALLLSLCLLASAPFAQAADITLVPGTPYRTYDLKPVDLPGSRASDATFMGGAGTPPDLAKLKQTWEWAFRDGFQLDGAHSYGTINMPAALGSLRAGRVVHISGEIAPGDAAKLRALVDREGLSSCLSPGRCPFTNVISLDSPGGSFGEALRLAQLIQDENFVTMLGPGTRCESACVLTFLAGYTTYEGFFYPRRFAHVSARIGVHQPSLFLEDRDYSASEVGQIQTLLTQSMNAVTGFFLRSGVSLGTLGRMYATPPERVYVLSPLDMVNEDIHLLSSTPAILPATRASALAFCTQHFVSNHNRISADILHNMQADDRSFITFELGSNYVCAGVREDTGGWAVQTCAPGECAFDNFGQVQAFELPADTPYVGQIDSIAVGLDNSELGVSIAPFAHRSALLAMVRVLHDLDPWRFRPIPLSTRDLKIQPDYCGRLDDAHPVLVREVQTGLNAMGIDVGRPDGSPGPDTRTGIRAAQTRLLGQSDPAGRITRPLLEKMRLWDTLGARFTLCDPAYEG